MLMLRQMAALRPGLQQQRQKTAREVRGKNTVDSAEKDIGNSAHTGQPTPAVPQ